MSIINWENDAEVNAFLRHGLLLANQPAERPVSALEYSPRYRRWEQRFLADPLEYAKKNARPIWKRVLNAAAMLILAVALMFGALVLVNPDVHAAVKQWFIERFQTHDAYRFGGEADAQSAGQWRPAYLPEGYAEVDRVDLLGYVIVTFEDESGNEIELCYQSTGGGNAFQVNNEHMSISEATIAASTAHVYQSMVESKPNMVLWMNEKKTTIFLLTSFEPCDTLIHIAESMDVAD